jgi:hypothetical protein
MASPLCSWLLCSWPCAWSAPLASSFIEGQTARLLPLPLVPCLAPSPAAAAVAATAAAAAATAAALLAVLSVLLTAAAAAVEQAGPLSNSAAAVNAGE